MIESPFKPGQSVVVRMDGRKGTIVKLSLDPDGKQIAEVRRVKGGRPIVERWAVGALVDMQTAALPLSRDPER